MPRITSIQKEYLKKEDKLLFTRMMIDGTIIAMKKFNVQEENKRIHQRICYSVPN